MELSMELFYDLFFATNKPTIEFHIHQPLRIFGFNMSTPQVQQLFYILLDRVFLGLKTNGCFCR